MHVARITAPATAFMAHVAATGAAFILGFCVVLAVLGAVWAVLDAIVLTARHLWS
jgi:hypothetical protein